MRDWRTDHAGVSPFTIDAGHFEADVAGVSYAYTKPELPRIIPFPVARVEIQQWVFGETVLKAGLLNHLDLETTIIPYQQIRQRTEISDFSGHHFVTSQAQGFGDMSARLKLNLWGNDGGKTALSLCGTAIFPTASDHFVDLGYRAGPSLEFAAQLPWQFELRVDSEAIIYEDFTHQTQATIGNSLSLSHPITCNLSIYGMFSAFVYSGDSSETVIQAGGGAIFIRYSSAEWRGYARTGFNYRIGKNLELFAGSSFGVHGSFAADYNPFVGIGARF